MITRFVFGLACFGLMFLAAAALGQEAVKKAPIPDDKAQAEAQALIRDVYKDEYSQATTAEKKAEFAKKLLQKAADTKDEPTNQFVLLRVARDMAAQAGDVDTAFQAVDELAAAFLIDPLEMNVQVLTKAASVTKKSDEQEQIVEAGAVRNQSSRRQGQLRGGGPAWTPGAIGRPQVQGRGLSQAGPGPHQRNRRSGQGLRGS